MTGQVERWGGPRKTMRAEFKMTRLRRRIVNGALRRSLSTNPL